MSSGRKRKNVLSVTNFIGKAINYGCTSCLALCSGYLLRHEVRPEIILLSASFIFSVLFFISYLICFDSDKAENMTEEQVAILQRDTLLLFLIIGMLALGWILTIHILANHKPISAGAIGNLILYAVLCSSYAAYLFRKFRHSGSRPAIRHQLVWSVVLTISIAMYSGMYLEDFYSTPIPLSLIIITVAYFVVSEIWHFSKKLFAISGVSLFICITIATSIAHVKTVSISFSDGLSLFLMSIVIAAYLSTLESWYVTALRACDDCEFDIGEGQPCQSTDKSDMLKKFYFSTLAALSISTLLVPIIYLFSRSGLILLAGFYFHAVTAFVFWYSYGGKLNRLGEINWRVMKSLFGFAFLIILVIGSKYNGQPSWPYIKTVSEFAPFWSVPAATIVALLVRSVKNRGFREAFNQRINYVRMFSLISFIACAVVLYVRQSEQEGSVGFYKANLSFLVYCSFILLSVIGELSNQLRGQSGRMSFALSLLGIIQTVRILTSAAIGAIVFFPGIYMGYKTTIALQSALPFFLAAMGGFALNDYCDAKKDKINKPRRAIPSGRLSRKQALIIACICLAIASSLPLLCAQNLLESGIIVVAIFGVVLYNYIVKYFGYSKIFFTAALCALPLLYNIVVYKYSFFYYWVVLSAFLFIGGRELLMDIGDVEGDRSLGTRTLPMIIGERKAAVVGFSAQLAGSLLLLFVSPAIISPFVTYALVLLIICSIGYAVLIWRSSCTKVDQRKAILFLWLPIFLGLSTLFLANFQPLHFEGKQEVPVARAQDRLR